MTTSKEGNKINPTFCSSTCLMLIFRRWKDKYRQQTFIICPLIVQWIGTVTNNTLSATLSADEWMTDRKEFTPKSSDDGQVSSCSSCHVSGNTHPALESINTTHTSRSKPAVPSFPLSHSALWGFKIHRSAQQSCSVSCYDLQIHENNLLHKLQCILLRFNMTDPHQVLQNCKVEEKKYAWLPNCFSK